MSIEGPCHFFTIYFPGFVFLCYTRPRYQVSVYRTIGPLVLPFLACLLDNIVNSFQGAALELLRRQGFTNDRALAPNIAVVITDGLSADPMATKEQVFVDY